MNHVVGLAFMLSEQGRLTPQKAGGLELKWDAVPDLQTMLNEGYPVQGWDAGTGRPTRETLRQLSLGEIEQVVWGSGVGRAGAAA